MEEKKLKKRKILAIMMASLALAGVGVETMASLNNSESIVEAKSRKRHHKRRITHKRKNKKRKTNKRRKKIKNKEYFSKGRFFSNGIVMTNPQRIDYHEYSERVTSDPFKVSNIYTPIITFKIINKTKREVDVNPFLNKHIRFYITNNSQKISFFPDTYMEYSSIQWTNKELKEMKNEDAELKPGKSVTILLGVSWPSNHWLLYNQWEINYLGNKGQIIKKENLPINVQKR